MASVSEEIPASQSERSDPHFLDLFAALAAPFEAHEIRTRTQGGRTFPYITARTVMNRLDEVLGPAGWWDEYAPGENSALCKLSICLPDGQVLTKQDAGGYAGMSDQGDDEKSGISDAFKRAAVKFGVGRYLYGSGVPAFVRDRYPQPEPPARDERLPSQARPSGNREADNGRRPHAEGSTRGGNSAPRSGRALFAWVKDMELKHQVGLLKYLNGWAKLQDFPSRMVDWDDDQVRLAHAEADRKLQTLGPPDERGDAYEEALAN